MSNGDDLNYYPGQRINPFSDGFKQRWNTAANAAEAVFNPQIDGQGMADLIPGQALNLETHPEDDPGGVIATIPRMLAWITGKATSDTVGHYTARQVVRDDSAGGDYIALPNGHIWDASGPGDLGDLICRQRIGSIPEECTVEVYAEIGDDGLVQWVFDAPGIVIPVTVEMVGGDNGTYQSLAPTWIYDVYDTYGNLLIHEATPENQRDECTYTVATRGYAWLNDGGEWELGWVNEEIDLPDFTQPTTDRYGYYQTAGFSEAGGNVIVALGVGGAAVETALAGAGGNLEFGKPERETYSDNYLGVSSRVVNGAGTDEVYQWIDFSEYKAERPPAEGDYLAWDGTTWEVATPLEVTIYQYRVDDSALEVQKRSCNIRVFSADDWGDWASIHDGVEC